MATVTQRIKEIKQPYGGYLKPREFEKIEFEDENQLKEENIHSTLVGLAVDYMSRYAIGTSVEEAFKISLMGARNIGESKNAEKLLQNIKGLDDISICNACKLVGYDVCFRSGPSGYKDVKTINPNSDTINNIKIMINRSIKFFEKYGPVIKDGFTFEGGYTETINSGDGDFLTSDTLWDFKVSQKPPLTAHTLQLLIYYIMGKHSIYTEFNNINKIGIFNPRLNCIFIKEIETIPQDIIDEVSNEVIGYNNCLKEEKSKNEELLTVTDVMKKLNCTRYMVMKLYAEQGLPLVKIKNKYYINKIDFFDWAVKMEEERKRREKINLITFMVCFIAIAIVMGFGVLSLGTIYL